MALRRDKNRWPKQLGGGKAGIHCSKDLSLVDLLLYQVDNVTRFNIFGSCLLVM